MSPQTNSSHLLTRRRILGLGGLGAVGGLAFCLGWHDDKPEETAARDAEIPSPHPQPGATAHAEPEGSPVAPGVLRREDFLPHLNSEFRIGPSETACTLVEVGPSQTQVGKDARFISFSLLFSAPRSFAADGEIQRLVHGKLETIELFLSPVGRADERIHLEAICSQRV